MNKFKLKDLPHYETLYKVWYSMNNRCKKEKSYINKNIKVCDKWKDKFFPFYLDCIDNYIEYINYYKEKPTIDRIDNNGNYEPNNCRWVSHDDNFCNSSNYNGNYKPKTDYPFKNK